MASVSKVQQSSKAKAAIMNEKPKPQEETEDFDAQVKEFFHFRLKRAGMFMDDLSGLNLNATNGELTGKVKRGLPEGKYERVRKAMALSLIERYDPRFPVVSEPPPKVRKDLRKTPEAKILMTRHKNMDPVYEFLEELGNRKGSRGALSLKVFYHLETQGHNFANRPRPEVVDFVEAQLKKIGVTDYRIYPEDEDGILILNITPEEYITNQ